MKSFITVSVLVSAFAVLFASAVSAAVLPRLNSGEHLNIDAIGTSLTDASVNAPNWFTQTGNWLQSTHPGKVTITDRAVSASASSTTNPRGGFLQLNDVLTYDNPDAIFIEFAINDAYTPYNISLAQSKANLQQMINTTHAWASSHAKQVDIIVCTMNDCIDPHASARPNLAQYYQGYREVAADNNLLLIDNYVNWLNLHSANPTRWNSYVPDRIHPSSTGAANVILPQVKSALQSQVPEPPVLALLTTAAIFGTFVSRRVKHRFFLTREKGQAEGEMNPACSWLSHTLTPIRLGHDQCQER